MLMAPFSCTGACAPEAELMKRKLSGAGRQSNEVVSPGVLLTLFILSSNSVPSNPFSGVEVVEKADTCRVLIVPGPLSIMFEEKVQLLAVSPAACTSGASKLTTAES